MAVYDGPNLGSEEHADRVWQMATDFLRILNRPLEGRERVRNRFRPKVLTKVSRRDKKGKKKKWSVGSSVAVSHFLRPLYLCNRICRFKPTLKRAVIYNEPLETAETNVEWQSEALGGERYEISKRPCQTCYSKFVNLHCFQYGESDQRPFSSAQCAEYCPINQLLPLDQEARPEDEITQELDTILGQFRQRCWFLYEDFGNIAQICSRICREASHFGDIDYEHLRNAYNEHVKDSVVIFGIRPELNGSLRPA
ncbi:unnamed protein product [Porites evermanni]|uniref:Uncharacterized protein n=1 Tax=Porites evermanni TaxID=104178 RepID=A0ABN8R510_9CNID|nr:unnamed protein product [Porites evermanni]